MQIPKLHASRPRFIRGITQRWVFRILGLLLVILVVVEVGLGFFVHSYYYNSIQMRLHSMLTSTRDGMMRYIDLSESEFRSGAQLLAENFAFKEQVELQVIDRGGSVIVSTSGFTPHEERLPDYYLALYSTESPREAYSTYQTSTGENVMAYTSVLLSERGVSGAVRLVVSTAYADQQIFWIIFILLLVGIGIFLFCFFSGMYFINSIVLPIKQVSANARKIAQGNFDVRIEKKYDDEIGDLCDTINYMAGELGATEKIKNDFISSVSHELRTPLTAIKGWGETIVSTMPEDSDDLTKKGLDVIIRESERLSGIVEELLDFSRLQSGRITLKMERIDILAELGEAVFLFQERSKRDQIELVYFEPEFLAPVLGDRDRLKQVFVNILDNAFKYSDPGGRVLVQVQEMTEESPDLEIAGRKCIEITISDKGCGIAPEDLGRIKEKFYKANTTRRGSGIGLAVADEIVARHNGLLEIHSVVSQGTDVVVRLPVAEN